MRRLIKDIVLPVAVAIALAFVIQASVAKPYEIPTGSMIPTIKENDRIIANRLIYRFRDIERGDIIVFDPTESALRTCQGSPAGVPFVKRVIGLPGDDVVIHDGLDEGGQPDPGEQAGTFVNGRRYTVKDALPVDYDVDFPTVPPDRLLVLGDNRPGSCDAHLWKPDPFVPEENVIGQAEVTYWPPSHLAFLD